MSNPLALHPLFSDHAVLPRDVPVSISGRSLPGQPVKVSLAGQQLSARTSETGRWEVTIDPLPAGGPHVLTVSSSAGQLIRRNLMVGEVWIAAGASGMALPIEKSAGGVAGIKRADLAKLRLFPIGAKGADTPQSECDGRWREATVQSATGFSAIALHFGRTMAEALECPVGLVEAAVPDSRVLPWMTGESIRSRGLRPPRLMSGEFAAPAGLFNAMIAPLPPFPVRGLIWMQGEADLDAIDSYRTAFIGLIHGWRKAWQRAELPFLFVQLPGARARNAGSDDEAWARLREAQTQAADLPASAMVVSADVVPDSPLAATDVRPIAHRLALAALAVAHKRSMPRSGPAPIEHTIGGSTFRIVFGPAGGGLRARGEGRVAGFVVAGSDRNFVPAEARIDGESVWVSSARVPNPVAVRYGWVASPELSLENGAGLPVSPFRTDDWPPRI